MTAVKPVLASLAGIPRTTQATVTEQLRRAILSGALPGGSRLTQAELANAFQVSITPVREALRELSTQGLIELDAFRCAVVHTPTLKELEEIYELRQVLIPYTVEHGIAKISPEELRQAETLLTTMERETDQSLWVDLNRQFHNLLEQAVDNSHVQATLRRLSDFSAIYVNLSFAKQPLQKEDSEREHRQILQAYQDRDPVLATQLTLAHVSATLVAARQVFRQE
ncbi:MAG: GntR family transcriptional regulator [Cyanobacteriota bacterium]|nr:GntR family transcriptional regulator [Cyanobacteriota bacterium]